MADQCCDQPHAQELESLAAELRESALDPTLAACCQRDLQEQAAVAKLKARLAAADRTNVRKQVAQGVLRQGPPPGNAERQEEEDELGTSDEDEALARFRAQRLEELQRGRAQKERLHLAGHGTLATVPSHRLLETATSSSGALVCHVAVEGCQACNELDEHLEGLAHRYLGTRFLRSDAPHGSAHLLHTLSLAGPGLVCFRDGALVGSVDLGMFLAAGDGGLQEELATGWLRGRRALQQAGPPEGAAQRGAHSSDEGSEEEGEDWQPACEVCGRRYPHQHIRSAFVSRREDSSDDEA